MYPSNLPEPLLFDKWLAEHVSHLLASNPTKVDGDVACLSKPPSPMATKYRSMWAFGNHLCVASVEQHLLTNDSGVVATFFQPCRASLQDTNIVMANLEYVGELHEIIEVNYNGLCVIVLLCKWVKANYKGNNATVKRDKWGFTLANFNSFLPFGSQSFAFPMHIDQGFFADAKEEPGWKVIFQKEVRGRRVYGGVGASEQGPLFTVEQDAEHEGLRAPEVVPEENPQRPPTERVVREDEGTLLDDWEVVDCDVEEFGSSSEEE